MNLLSNLQDQFRHMEWADAMVWNVVLSSESATSDETIRTRLHHIHLVQRTFFAIWRGEFAHLQDPNERQAILMKWFNAGRELQGKDLMTWAQEYHRDVQPYVANLPEAALETLAVIPWADMIAARLGVTPAISTRADTMTQVVSHSTYHRGQVNTRLRELGAEPPLVDFIAWVWLGKPAAQWNS